MNERFAAIICMLSILIFFGNSKLAYCIIQNANQSGATDLSSKFKRNYQDFMRLIAKNKVPKTEHPIKTTRIILCQPGLPVLAVESLW